VYKLEYLPSAKTDVMEIDAYLYKHSPSAADKFADSIEKLTETLLCYPLMFPFYEDDTYFRHIVLPYKYYLFYHVDEEAKIIKIYRVLHGIKDIKSVS